MSLAPSSIMARCGVWQRHPVIIVRQWDDGSVQEGPAIGDAETVAESIALAGKMGFQVRDASDGGHCRLAQNREDSKPCFLVTIYP